jgi:hypothetical protein
MARLVAQRFERCDKAFLWFWGFSPSGNPQDTLRIRYMMKSRLLDR